MVTFYKMLSRETLGAEFRRNISFNVVLYLHFFSCLNWSLEVDYRLH